jgi:hypothetical protein
MLRRKQKKKILMKNLAAAMQRTKDAIARDLFFPRPKRPKEDNPYIHGALNAIREQAKTV